ncbi:hypothetical protein GHK62_05850 [Sinorhizobium terangae]|uniref:Uncharacterized protein n=1 Tax=Sinorhizobium terangae TaxID=110322 RepID=A0A6N7LAP3_SINTE|nr:hypothetical protein [Sinorhizobium terangae]
MRSCWLRARPGAGGRCRPSDEGGRKRVDVSGQTLLHVSLNRPRFKDKDMQQFKVLQRPLRV